jgi:hypothetical protein
MGRDRNVKLIVNEYECETILKDGLGQTKASVKATENWKAGGYEVLIVFEDKTTQTFFVSSIQSRRSLYAQGEKIARLRKWMPKP